MSSLFLILAHLIFINFIYLILILNRLKCQQQIFSSVGFEPTTLCICGKRHPSRPQGNIPQFRVECEECFEN